MVEFAPKRGKDLEGVLDIYATMDPFWTTCGFKILNQNVRMEGHRAVLHSSNHNWKADRNDHVWKQIGQVSTHWW